MKLKKFFAGVLAAAMMLTVGATAAFATEGNKVDASYEGTAGEYNAKMFVPVDGKAEIDLTKVLTVVSGTAPDSMKFNFNVYEGTETTGTALDTKSVEFNAGNYTSKGDEKNNGVYTGTFKLDVAKLTEGKSVGKYTFTIVESMDKAYQSVTAERGTVKMVISKVNAKEVDSTADFGYFVALYDSEGNKILATDAFKNKYGDGNIQNLKLSKTVHGALGNLSKDFTFKIKFTKANDLKNNTNTGLYKGPQVTDLSDTATIKDGTTNIDKNAYLELDKEYTVTLQHGDSLDLSNLPAGIKYEIYENGSQVDNGAVVVTVDEVKYTVTVTNMAFDTTENTKIKDAISDEDVTVAFQNTNPDSPDMGVVLDNAPYIAMLAIVAIGGVALMLNKRRRDEE